MANTEPTISFSIKEDREKELKRTLTTVYEALLEKGYNPINQLVGYILSEDPTYITTHNNARALIRHIDRDELLQVLLRSGNTLYYGNPAESCVAMLKILSTKDDAEKTADRVLVQILSTDETLPPKDRMIKKTEKNGLYEALNIASIWLERSLNPSA